MAESLSAIQEFKVRAELPQVWGFIEDFTNWAQYMPGYVSSERIDADHFTWILQADLGPMSRQVTMDVHVTRWNAPEEVDFTLQGRGEPFSGSGKYRGASVADGVQVELHLEVVPQGSMAKLIRVLAEPLLTRTASTFSARLVEAIETRFPRPAQTHAVPPKKSSSWHESLRNWWLSLLGRSGQGTR